jgi:hypothetical protein
MEKSPQYQATRGAPRRRSGMTARARNRARADMMGALVKRAQGEKKIDFFFKTPKTPSQAKTNHPDLGITSIFEYATTRGRCVLDALQRGAHSFCILWACFQVPRVK